MLHSFISILSQFPSVGNAAFLASHATSTHLPACVLPKKRKECCDLAFSSAPPSKRACASSSGRVFGSKGDFRGGPADLGRYIVASGVRWGESRQELRPLRDALRFVELSGRENWFGADDDDDEAVTTMMGSFGRCCEDDGSWKPDLCVVRSLSSRRDAKDDADNADVAYWSRYCRVAAKLDDGSSCYFQGALSDPKNSRREPAPTPEANLHKENIHRRSSVKSKAATDKCLVKISTGNMRARAPLATISNFLPVPKLLDNRSISKSSKSSTRHVSNSAIPLSSRIPNELPNASPIVGNLQRKAIRQSSRVSSVGKFEKTSARRDSLQIHSEKSSKTSTVDFTRDASISLRKSDHSSPNPRNNGHRDLGIFNVKAEGSLDGPPFTCHAFPVGHWKLSISSKSERAAVSLQAFWRMYKARKHYRRIQWAAVAVQRRWRWHQNLHQLGRRSLLQASAASEEEIISVFKRLPDFSVPAKAKDECSVLSLDLRYTGSFASHQEDELLMELGSWLSLGSNGEINNAWDCKQETKSLFPMLDVNSELSTPALSWQKSKISKFPSIQSIERERQTLVQLELHLGKFTEEESDLLGRLPALLSFPEQCEPTDLADIESFLSPHMEKEVLDELAKLFPPLHKQGKSALTDLKLSNNSKTIPAVMDKDGREMVGATVQVVKDGLTAKKLTFEGENLDRIPVVRDLDEGSSNKVTTNVSFLKRHPSASLLHYHCSERSKSNPYFADESMQLHIPSLAAKPLVMANKAAQRGVESPSRFGKILVESLSECQSLDFDGKMEGSAFQETKEVGEKKEWHYHMNTTLETGDTLHALHPCLTGADTSSDTSSHLTSRGPFSSPTTSDITTESAVKAQIKCSHFLGVNSLNSTASSSKPKSLLEASDQTNLIICAKASFQYQVSMLQNFDIGKVSQHNERRELELNVHPETLPSASCIREMQEEEEGIELHHSVYNVSLFDRESSEPLKENVSQPVQNICVLWHEHNVDMPAHSLKYMNLSENVLNMCSEVNFLLLEMSKCLAKKAPYWIMEYCVIDLFLT
eukprot:c19197_g1_i2 orf=976-4107(-)